MTRYSGIALLYCKIRRTPFKFVKMMIIVIIIFPVGIANALEGGGVAQKRTFCMPVKIIKLRKSPLRKK